MEIKTAEQYIVAELLDKKEELAKTKDELRTYEFDYQIMREKYLELRDLIRKHIRIRTTSDGDDYIAFESSIWKTYNEAEYNKWTSIFPDLFDRAEDNEDA